MRLLTLDLSIALFVNVIALFSLCRASARKGYFWHVNDFHYDPTYWTRQLSCNSDVPNPEPFGDYWCDSPWRLVQDTVQNMANIKSDVDFVIWTGDTVAHLKDADMSVAKSLKILENVTALLNQTFPKSVAFFSTPGNHDFYPSDQADVVEDDLYDGMSEIWRQWIDQPKQRKRFRHGGFYHKLVQPKLRIMSLNTNLYYIMNHVTKGMADPAGQFQWMDETLTQARADGEKVIIIAHIAPGVKAPDMGQWFYQHHQDRFIDILTKFSDIIVASNNGHEHLDGFRIIEDSKNASKAIPHFQAPSVTPWRFKLPGKTGLPHNPGIRLVEYDRDTGLHINFIQYFINLTDTNRVGFSSWKPLYNFSESYGVPDMSAASIRDIFSRMEQDGGEVLAKKYCNYAYVSKYEQYCPERYRWEIVCAGQIHDLETVNKCVKEFVAGSAMMLRVDVVFYIVIFLISSFVFAFIT